MWLIVLAPTGGWYNTPNIIVSNCHLMAMVRGSAQREGERERTGRGGRWRRRGTLCSEMRSMGGWYGSGRRQRRGRRRWMLPLETRYQWCVRLLHINVFPISFLEIPPFFSLFLLEARKSYLREALTLPSINFLRPLTTLFPPSFSTIMLLIFLIDWWKSTSLGGACVS